MQYLLQYRAAYDLQRKASTSFLVYVHKLEPRLEEPTQTNGDYSGPLGAVGTISGAAALLEHWIHIECKSISSPNRLLSCSLEPLSKLLVRSRVPTCRLIPYPFFRVPNSMVLGS